MTSLEELPTPALLVDRARMEANLAAMSAAIGAAGVALRPHFKTSKCLAVARRQLAHGAIGFTCATPAEVGLLQDEGVGDVLWAHQPVGPAKVAFAVGALARGGLTIALDSLEAAAPLAEAAASAGVTVPFVLEVDTGLHRAGVDPDRAVATAAALTALPALELRGVLTHEGHLAAHGSDRAGLEAAGDLAGRTLVQVAEALRAAGHACPLVSVGSTPGATSAPFAAGVTEARPGTYVYFDANQVGLGSARIEQCAQTVLTRVTSAQRPGTVIIDAGIKAMSSDTIATAGILGIVCDPSGRPLDGVEFTAGNEEHGYLTRERPVSGSATCSGSSRTTPAAPPTCGARCMSRTALGPWRAIRSRRATESHWSVDMEWYSVLHPGALPRPDDRAAAVRPAAAELVPDRLLGRTGRSGHFTERRGTVGAVLRHPGRSWTGAPRELVDDSGTGDQARPGRTGAPLPRRRLTAGHGTVDPGSPA